MLTAVVVLYLCSDGVVSMGEYMSFMISRETENVGSSQEVINAFKALTEGGKRPYVTEAELYQVIIQKNVDTLYRIPFVMLLLLDA